MSDGPSLIKRQDVIDRLTQAHILAQRKRDDIPPNHNTYHYWDGYDDGLLDMLDVLSGYCHPTHAIDSVKPTEGAT